MNLINIQTFLCVANRKSLSAASALLFVSQSTVTSRLQQLEEELGVQLFFRKKGIRTVELTSQGQAFLPLAERWMALNSETVNFASQHFSSLLKVGCPDSLSEYLFQPLYKTISQPKYGITLHIHTHQSPEIFSLVDSKDIDVGFAFHLSRFANVISRPLFSEKCILLCSSLGEWPDRPIAPEELDPRAEVYLAWSQDIQFWHESIWNPTISPLVQVDKATHVALYMENPRSWALCPASIAEIFLRENKPVELHELTVSPPPRICYYLVNRTVRNNAVFSARKTFEREMISLLQPLHPIISLIPDTVKSLSSAK